MSAPSIRDAEALILHEARLLDERRFAEWLDLYESDAVYWMPAWKDDNTQTSDPGKEVSLIYYRGRAHLKDRVDRLTSGLSPASRISPRVAHTISNVALVQASDTEAQFCSTFVVHSYDPRNDRVSCRVVSVTTATRYARLPRAYGSPRKLYAWRTI
jgi:benzoate/toluate 1,2-dioxygenase subunit beta